MIDRVSINSRAYSIKIVLLSFLIAQPFIDIITSIQVRNGSALTFGVVIRTVFMAAMFFYVVFLSKCKEKKVCIWYLILVTLYCVLFLAQFLLYRNVDLIIGNAKEMVKTFYVCYVLIGFYVIYRDYNYVVSNKLLSIIITVYMSAIFVAYITNSSFKSYTYGYGYNGWFYAANEIGSIFSLLAPIAVATCFTMIFSNQVKSGYRWILLFPIFLIIFCSTYIGTRVSFFGIVLYLALFLVWSATRFMQTRKRNLLYQLLLCFVMLICIGCIYNNSPVQKNSNINSIKFASSLSSGSGSSESSNQRASSVDQKSSSYASESSASSEQQSAVISSSPKQPDLIYNVANRILNNRLYFLKPTQQEFDASGLLKQSIGLGYVNTPDTKNDITKAIEMDLVSVYYRHGYIGFLVFILPLLYFTIKIVSLFFRNIKKTMSSVDLCTYFYSLALGFFVSLTAGHTLIAPAVSIYVIIVLMKIIFTYK